MDLKNETPVMRVLRLLTLMAEQETLSLEEAHLLTGLSKSTLTRAFLSLEQAGWVHRYLGNHKYTYIPPYSDKLRDEQIECVLKKRLAVLVKPILEGLYQITGLSTDFTFMFDELVIVESSFGLTDARVAKRAVIGLGVDLQHSSMGKAYSAALAGQHRDGMYYARKKQFWGYKELKQTFNISAIAIPVFYQQQPIGSINLAWFDTNISSYEETKVAEQFLTDLYQASQRIADAISESGLDITPFIRIAQIK
ncbi:helix-turn-helix domain-containing protein [Photobacterium halotolerans]|uniref:HTH iclR-type domain-containing protein n=1 Tax=Photobacterium halotolerans TaxID=265726 RepID=A0A0F5VFB7_9GAMM|nr:helix-turn-helix domain-containing protein [Photobacterium halotolerans]KKD00165.1 hypothetical protein KY46_09800 [Photobacterium halotolerans]